MAIDEKKLVKDLKKYFVNNTIHKNDLAEVIANQPKISLENKTSDNMNSSCSGQVWIPCKGCYNCGHKECEHYGKS